MCVCVPGFGSGPGAGSKFNTTLSLHFIITSAVLHLIIASRMSSVKISL